MIKLFSLKIFGKFFVIVMIGIFFWIMTATSQPIKPLREKPYFACLVNNIDSWENTGSSYEIKSFKSSSAESENYIEFIYKDPPKYAGQPSFFCKYPLPEMMLYKATTLNVAYKLNQPAFFDVGIHKFGQGPGWKAVEVDSENINKTIISTWLLHDFEQPKLNWLSGSYEGVSFGVSKFDTNKELILTIYRVYFE